MENLDSGNYGVKRLWRTWSKNRGRIDINMGLEIFASRYCKGEKRLLANRCILSQTFAESNT